MKCPHCTVNVHEGWSDNVIRYGAQVTSWRIEIMRCPACGNDILRFGIVHLVGLDYQGPAEWRMIYPIGSNRGPIPPDVPKEIAADYQEAAAVLPLSAKASAALSRRCLQTVLREAGYTQKDLAKQIDAVLAEPDTRKALPTSVHSILDAIRNFGNFSAHRITDQTTLQVIDVEPHEAEFCLDILDSVFDHYYVKPAEAKRAKAALDVKLAAAKKPPAK